MKNYLFISCLFFVFAKNVAQSKKLNLWVGTYTQNCQSDGIYLYEFDEQNGKSKLVTHSQTVVNPSYLSLSKNKKTLYAVNENGPQSTVSAFDVKANQIIFQNSQASKGADPCHIINDEKNVIVANYSGGNITVFKKNTDGSLSEAQQVVQHQGKGFNDKRQQSPHVHQVVFSSDNQYILSNDLGLDKIYLYQYNPNQTKDILTKKDSVLLKKGAGPRHLTFDNKGKYVYVLQELNGVLSVFEYQKGQLKWIQDTSVVLATFEGETSAADVHITKDNRYLYATNRGAANTISCFEIRNDGKLTFLRNQSTNGKGPRNFVLSPNDKYLLIAHQYTNTIEVFERNRHTGTLKNTSKSIALCSPVCLIFDTK
ncbi:lactonase family protein [Flavobacterium branchiophilum]|uniref:Probable 6-phosphogluconolactonase n=1 Tax=Flavobacterium branchiophilum (strain FL-15) TaxID=1034807 RepID=G2Z0S9_FLABF|nr:lactonase family protein [Flavobacterium branchiophilum]CCB69474.1 Probable 6-phosphogluconolactonase precursor [Flavobacterium branchiophilum FL-15]